jgi:RNA polymerase sigma factor (TIGR02999 family)
MQRAALRSFPAAAPAWRSGFPTTHRHQRPCRGHVRMTVRDALDEDLPVVYETLKRIARSHLRGERAGHTLNTTALVHEAYLRLVGIGSVDWTDRARFLGMASRAMRRVLIDHARARARLKRSSPQAPFDEGSRGLPAEDVEELLALDAALHRLETLAPRQCRVVECRFFAGMTNEETAEVLAVSLASVKRDWTIARAFLNAELTVSGVTPTVDGG